MGVFILKRLIGSLMTLLLIFFISSWIISLIPGSYDDLIKADEFNSELKQSSTQIKSTIFYFSIFPDKGRVENWSDYLPDFKWNGLQNSFHNKLVSFCTFQFGYSIIDRVSVSEKIGKALPWSFALQLPAIIFVIIISIFIASKSILYPDSKLLKILNLLLLWIHSIPGFWLATILLFLFANPDVLPLFPSGMQSISFIHPFKLWILYPQYYILPLLCLVIPSLAYLTRFIKNGLEDSLQRPFWIRALSSGLSVKQALKSEAMPHALIPLIVWLSGIFPALISGSLIIEQIFSIPGLGRLMYQSIAIRDWPVVEVLFILGSFMTILGFFISDVLLRVFDPRIQNNLK